ncbi:hypothetical protein PPBDW_II1088 [Photobacterium kishitanii]|nr:hypothetical protein PPBDW_II1088 [Photobacterium kishitanii]
MCLCCTTDCLLELSLNLHKRKEITNADEDNINSTSKEVIL